MVFPKKKVPDLEKRLKFLPMRSCFTNIYSNHIVNAKGAPIPMSAVN